jgi:hypothetical protein
MFSKPFWVAATERAAKSAAQAAIIAFGGDVVNAWAIDVKEVGGIVLGAAILSYLTSIVSSNVGAPGTPSLVVPKVPEGEPKYVVEAEHDDTLEETVTSDVPPEDRR